MMETINVTEREFEKVLSCEKKDITGSRRRKDERIAWVGRTGP